MNTATNSFAGRVDRFRRLDRARKQQGLSFISLLAYFALGGIVVLLALKLIPVYLEYFSIKKVLASMSISEEVKTGTVGDIRRSFEKRSQIDNIVAIKAADLEITKEGGDAVVSAAWQQEVPLFPGWKLVIDFNVSTASK
jgi:hypothetical protein